MKTLKSVLIGVLALVVAVGAVFLIGMRTKSPMVVDNVRRFNRSFTNRRVMRSAGSVGASASVIRHVGRSSGRRYETPVGPYPTADGFLVALPYGPRADWVRNVLAAGDATLLHEGHTYAVVQPAIVATAEVERLLPASEQRTLRLFNVEQCLFLSNAQAPEDEPVLARPAD